MPRPPEDDDPPPIFHEATVDLHIVPGAIRCPVCRAQLEVRLEPLDPERLVTRPPVSRGGPIPLPKRETAPDPKAEGG